MTKSVIIVGAGVFGASAALTLSSRGYRVSLLDPGPLPHPLAESTDISKIVRLDYGADEDYLNLMELALPRWRQWNTQQAKPLFHETGVAFLCRQPMQAGGFEYESFRLLSAHGHKPQRLERAQISARFAAFANLQDGYFNPLGGYAESGAVVSWLLEEAVKSGVALYPSFAVQRIIEKNNRVLGVIGANQEALYADEVLIAAGSWVPSLVPELSSSLRSVGQPVFHLRPKDPSLFASPHFPVFGGDISKTGYYGFPLSSSGVVKIANHGIGRQMHPESEARVTTAEEEASLRLFVQENIPALAEAPIEYRRVCVYCDTIDEHFWIARDPQREGLTIATGGSGHAFKFAPVLGDLIADALEAKPNPFLAKFRWRTDLSNAHGEEAARKR